MEEKVEPTKQEEQNDKPKKLKDSTKEQNDKKRPHEMFYKIFRILGNILFVPFIIIIIFCSVLMLKSKVRNEVPSLFGYSAVKILSSSMEPNFSKGDIVVVKKVDTSTLKVGDVIAFYEYYEDVDQNDLNNNATMYVSMNTQTTIGSFLGAGTDNDLQQKAAKNYSRVIFHRIVEISTPTNPADEYYGKKFFKTKGDNNTNPDDNWLLEDYVVGIGDETSKNTFIGKLFQFCTTTVGIICLVIIPSLILIGIYVVNILGEVRKNKRKQKEEEEDNRQADILSEVTGEKQEKQKLEESEKKKQEILDEVLKDIPKHQVAENHNANQAVEIPTKPVVKKTPPKPKPEFKPDVKVEKPDTPKGDNDDDDGLKKKRPVWKKDIS